MRKLIKIDKNEKKTSKIVKKRPIYKGDSENSDFWDFLFKNTRVSRAKNDKKTQKINKKSSKIGLYIRAILKIVIFCDFL